jgi:hypothetical protein
MTKLTWIVEHSLDLYITFFDFKGCNRLATSCFLRKIYYTFFGQLSRIMRELKRVV